MSRAYRIRVAESERRYVTAEDRVCTDIELLPILPPERLGELLAVELSGRGFVVADGVARRVDDDVEVEVELETGRVSARLEDRTEAEHSASRTVAATGTKLPAKTEAQVRGELKADVERKFTDQQARLQTEVTAKLEGRLRDLQQEVDAVSNRVAANALKEKAAQLGEIVELIESESGEVTIKVKV